MEPPLVRLYLLVLGLVVAISDLAVNSQPQSQVTVVESQSHPSVTTPSAPSSSPPAPLTLPPRPSPSPLPPSPPPPPPPPQQSPTPPSLPSKDFSPPPPPWSGERNRRRSLPPPHTKSHEFRKKLPPPPKSNKLNTGKKIGWLFAGLAGILQIGVVGFLIYKRGQLLKVRNRYETCT